MVDELVQVNIKIPRRIHLRMKEIVRMEKFVRMDDDFGFRDLLMEALEEKFPTRQESLSDSFEESLS